MGSFGEKLKREREMRAITLEEIAEATKIGTRSLKALEEEHFDLLPGGIFNKGFVRAYAKFLGLDEEQAVADYLAATNEVGNSTTMQMQALADEAERARAANEAAQESSGTGATIAVIIAIVVLCFIGFGGYKAWKYKKEQATVDAATPAPRRQAQPPVTLQNSTETAAPATNPDGTTPTSNTTPGMTVSPSTATPGATTPATSTPPPDTGSAPANSTTKPSTTSTPASTSEEKPAKQAYPIVVSIKAVKSAWVQAKSDGKVVYSGEMNPSDSIKSQVTLHANDKMTLLLGNAGGVEVTVNGKPAGTLGALNKSREVTITPQGIQQ